MIDLNVRLDSSLTEDDYCLLARSQEINIEETFPKCRSFSFENATKEDYENVRKFSLSLLQTEEALTFATQSLIHRLYNDGYHYLEITLTPYLHKDKRLSQKKILKAVLIGLNDAYDKCPGIDVNLILNCHRQASDEYNTETTRLALEYRDERVVAVGLEGDDKDHPVADYEKLFARCRRANYPVVIELGKHYNSNDSIFKAAQIGAMRIISPYKITLNNETFRIIRERGVFFEFTPSMDILYRKWPDLASFPLRYFWNQGLPAFIAGSSYTILNASLGEEFIRISKNSLFTRDDVNHSLSIAIQAGFFGNIRERNRVMKKVIADFDHFYNSIS